MHDNPNQPEQYRHDLVTKQQAYTAYSYDPNNTRKQVRNLNYRSLLLLGLIVVLLVACVAGITSLVIYNSINTTPSRPNHPVLPHPTPPKKRPTLTPSDDANPTMVAQGYCDALKNKNYNKADSFFDPQGTIGEGIQLKMVSVDLLAHLDALKGSPIETCTVSTATTNLFGEAFITMSVQRHQKQPYDVHLTLVLENKVWKITNVDAI